MSAYVRWRYAPLLIVTLGLVAGCATPNGTGTTSDPTTATGSNGAAADFPMTRQLFALGETLGKELTSVRLATGLQSLQYGDPFGNGIGVQVFAKGQDAARAQLAEQYEQKPAPPVFDRPANYLYLSTGEGPRLGGIAFQWAPDAWAHLFHTPNVDDAQLVALAGSLRTDVDEPARFGVHLIEAMPFAEGADGPGLLSGVTLGLDENPTGLTVTVRVDFDDVRWVSEGEPMKPNATVGGKPAWVDSTDVTYTVFLLEAGRPAVSVMILGEGYANRLGATQAQALALSVQPLGSWTDRSQWTENPIR